MYCGVWQKFVFINLFSLPRAWHWGLSTCKGQIDFFVGQVGEKFTCPTGQVKSHKHNINTQNTDLKTNAFFPRYVQLTTCSSNTLPEKNSGGDVPSGPAAGPSARKSTKKNYNCVICRDEYECRNLKWIAYFVNPALPGFPVSSCYHLWGFILKIQHCPWAHSKIYLPSGWAFILKV